MQAAEEMQVADPELVDLIERIVIAGVAVTNVSLSRARQGIDLTFPQWRVLVILGRRPGGAALHEIAELIEITLPATSRQVRRLVHRQLVTLERDPVDRRVTRARLTEAGEAAAAAIMADRRARIAGALASTAIDPRQHEVLHQVANALEQVELPPRPSSGLRRPFAGRAIVAPEA